MSKSCEFLAVGFAYFFSGAFVISFLSIVLAAVGFLLAIFAGLLGIFS